jgi:hypothetical protein
VCMILVYSVDQSNPMTIANQIHQINPPASLVRRRSPSPVPRTNSASALAAEASWWMRYNRSNLNSPRYLIQPTE